MKNITNLNELLDYIKNNDIDDREMCDLPTFGGDAPDDTTHVWSWDDDRLLVGTCSDDYGIMTREEWGQL